MISLNNITKEFNGEALFTNVSFNMNNKDCIGLAGKNGAGKTTLIRIIAGELPAESGQVVIPNDLEIGYLPQEKIISSTLSILDEVLLVVKFIDTLKQRNEEINNIIQQRTDFHSKEFKKLLDEQLKNEEQIRLAEPEKMLGRAERILTGLGFHRSEFEKPLNVFSFGWQMRVEIAKLLLSNPFLLLLDEPTNHLDIESIQWFEDYLSSYHGSVLIVSHDRTFLDKLTNRTIEINNGNIYDYKVSYSRFIQLREERLMHQKAAFDNQQREIREVERFVERFRYKASKARQVQSRVKHLEKMDKVEIDDLNKSAIHFSFPPAPHSGKITVSGKSVSKSYGNNLVLDKIDFQILKGEKIAFVGRNGEGKSTLAKIIADNLAHNGEVAMGHQVVTAYYSQDQWDMLNPDLTVFETLDEIAVGDIRKRLKTILGSFLFRGDDVDKKVKVLSGGEKTRLALAKLLLVPNNLLILDEPTNHLDILSKDILKNALLRYDGSLIIVSHDRDFLQGLTNRLYEFKNRKIKEFIGDIFEYLEKRKLSQLKELEYNDDTQTEKSEIVSDNKQKWEKKKELEKKLRKLKASISKIEQSIESKEVDIEQINAKLAEPERYEKEIKSGELYKNHDQVTTEIAAFYEEWESKQKDLELIEEKFKSL